MNKKIAYLSNGTPELGRKIINTLIQAGGINDHSFKGEDINSYYYIGENNTIYAKGKIPHGYTLDTIIQLPNEFFVKGSSEFSKFLERTLVKHIIKNCNDFTGGYDRYYKIEYGNIMEKEYSIKDIKISDIVLTVEQLEEYLDKIDDSKKIIGYLSTEECWELPVGTLFVPNFTPSDIKSNGGYGYYPKNGTLLAQTVPRLLVEKYFTPVYKYEIKLPKINGYEGEIVGDNIVKYGCQSYIFDEIKDLVENTIIKYDIQDEVSLNLKDNHSIPVKYIMTVYNELKKSNKI